MIRRPTYVLALALLLCVAAAQVHVCFEASAAQRSQHQCQLCRSGGWAVAEPEPSLDAQVASNPLPDKPATRSAERQPVEASSSRAPPQS